MVCLPPVWADSSGPADARDSPSHLWKNTRMIRTKCLSVRWGRGQRGAGLISVGLDLVSCCSFRDTDLFSKAGGLPRSHSSIVMAEARAGSGTLGLYHSAKPCCVWVSVPILVRSCHGEWIGQGCRKPLLRLWVSRASLGPQGCCRHRQEANPMLLHPQHGSAWMHTGHQ